MPRSTAIARLVRAAGFAATVGGSVLGGIAHGQTTTWALPGDGVWNSIASWTNGIPSAGNSAIINIPITAFISGGASTEDLTLSLPGTVATIASGGEFYISGSSVVNNGEIVVNTSGGSFDANIFFTGLACTLSGTGSVVLGPNNTGLATDSGFQTTTAGGIVTNSAGHTIKGNGYVPAGLSNFGLITADAANKQLNLYANPKANSGTVLASNGGTIAFSSCAITQTGAGVIRAIGAGSTAFIGSGGCSLTGGVWEGISGGVASTGGDVTVDSITTNGTIHVRSAEVMNVLNTLTNTGTITINPTGGSSDAYISFNTPTSTLTGGGTIVLNPVGGTSGADAGFITNVPTNIVTNAAGNTIRGNGYINANINNQGLINADIPSRSIGLVVNPKSNSGLLLASNGGTLDINGIAITQTGTTRADGANSVVEAHGSITGGVLESVNGGLVRTGGALTLDGVTVNGTMHVQSGQSIAFVNAITNTGTIIVNPTGGATDATISFNSPTITLSGGGTIVLNPIGAGVGQDAGLNTSVASNVVTNPAGATIRGNGYINANINNQGLMAADIPARSLILATNPKSNSGLMLASNGGTLDINGIAITQSSGGVVRADGASSIVEVHGTMSGGTLESINSGLVRTGADLTISSTTLNGTMHVQAGHRLGLDASLVNNAVVTVNPTGSASNADINILASLTLQGTGTVVFNGVGSTNDANVFGTTAVTLTNGSAHTLAGNGEINVRLTNDGILSPGQPVSGDRTQDLRRNANFADITCTSSSVVNIDIEGAAAGQFDRIISINTQSDFVCAGTLNVSHINGYTGSPVNTTFDIITAAAPATITGTFSTVNTPLLPGGFHYAVKYLPTAVRLQVVCPADVDDDGTFPGANADGGVDINDLLFFLAAFEAGSSAADLDDGTNSGIPDNGVDISDLLFFLSHFEAGC